MLITRVNTQKFGQPLSPRGKRHLYFIMYISCMRTVKRITFQGVSCLRELLPQEIQRDDVDELGSKM